MKGKDSQGLGDMLFVKILEILCFRMPLGIAQGFLALLFFPHKSRLRVVIRGVSLVLCVFVTGLGIYVLIHREGLSRNFGTRLGMFYFGLVAASLPVFLLAAYFLKSQKDKLFKAGARKVVPDQESMWRFRFQSNQNQVYLGQSFERGEPVFLTNDQRSMHTQVVGSTGTGKSESVLLPLFTHDIAHGKGAIIIDGKGDLELLDRIVNTAKAHNRLDAFYFFSLAHPKISNSYNPLRRGNATELKDKLIGSMPWSEEFYRRMAEQAALVLFNALVKKGSTVKFSDLHLYLTDYGALKGLTDSTRDIAVKTSLEKMGEQFKTNSKFLSGLIADLFLMSNSEFSSLVNVGHSEIDLLDVYKTNKIVYFQLDLQGYGDTAKRIGRMILQDIRTVSGHIQSYMPEAKRHFFPVFIDDASSFLDLNFIDFLNKARAAKIAITLLHQSLGDLVIRRDTSFQQQVLENTNIKIILRQDDPQSVEKFSMVGGTRTTVIPTYQTEDNILGKGFTGVGSIREGQAFRIDPDLIRALERGEAVVIWKNPTFHTDYVKLDFFGYPAFPSIQIGRNEEIEKNPEVVGSGTKDVDSPESGEETKNMLQVIEDIEEEKA